MAWATSSMFAPVASQIAERALMEEMRCASMALAASLDSSEDHRPTVKILSCLIHHIVVSICSQQRKREKTHGTQFA